MARKKAKQNIKESAKQKLKEIKKIQRKSARINKQKKKNDKSAKDKLAKKKQSKKSTSKKSTTKESQIMKPTVAHSKTQKSKTAKSKTQQSKTRKQTNSSKSKNTEPSTMKSQPLELERVSKELVLVSESDSDTDLSIHGGKSSDNIFGNNDHNKNKNNTSVSAESEKQNAIMREPSRKRRKLNLFSKKKGMKAGESKKNTFASQSKKIQIKSFKQLKTSADFGEINIEFYLKRLSVIPGKRLILNVITDGEIVSITGGKRTIIQHQDYESNRWYNLKGGQIKVYKGNKQIIISSHSVIVAIKKPIKPVIDFSSKRNIIQDFTRIANVAENLQTQCYIGGFVDEIGKQERLGVKYRTQVTIRDINGIGMYVNLWHEQDREQAERMKINNTLILTGWKLTTKPALALTNTGIMFINATLPKAAQTTEMMNNLSEINYQEISRKSHVLSLTAAFQCALSGKLPHSNTDYYLLNGVKISGISNVFRFKDADDNDLSERFGGLFLDHEGSERKLDLNNDSISYYLRLTLQDTEIENTALYVTGFDEAGVDLFDMNARQLYEKMKDDGTETSDLVEEFDEIALSVLLSVYVNKMDQIRWTLSAVIDNWINDAKPLN